MTANNNAMAWGHESILNFFESERQTSAQIYPSEWFFLKQKMAENMSILDIGCAKGGMASVLAENLEKFEYVGVDINRKMIQAAKMRLPQHQFYQIEEDDYSLLNGKLFDIVLCLGILHMHENWRNTIKEAWLHTKKYLILDLRETHLPTIENKDESYFIMDFDNPTNPTSDFTVPYNIINTAEVLQTLHDICPDASRIAHYGYSQKLSALTVSPLTNIMATAYCIERPS
jgi:2-polyprenyl-3-methyl-5-hydroxy-6-metoxy-1,4-benzoquinol methylase